LLRYVNAGHNAPILCRTDGGRHRILRFEEGGVVIGLFPNWVYQEGSLQLKPGDTLVAFTDGISEAMNDRDEEWDEERLIAAICESHGRTAADTIVHILGRVDDFTGGAGQHDDMTLVVVRVQ
jgi:sigma-B regulation protein RsbU (phosphoserine phosphatase)